MSKHMRLIVSVLFIVIIFLAIAITRFYSDTSKSASGGSAQTDIERRLAADPYGNQIFEDSNGLFGIVDDSDRVIVPAEWAELSFAGESNCIAAKRISGSLMKGCIDYEGNIIVPFIYRSIDVYESGEQKIFAAHSASDDSVVVYDSKLMPAFRKVWKSCELSDDMLKLVSAAGTYTYSADESGFVFTRAAVSGSAFDSNFELNISARPVLEKLDPAMLEYMVSAVGSYLEFAYSGDGNYIADIRTGGRPVLTKLFPDETRIVSKKLAGIKEISISLADPEDDKAPHYSIAVSADTELTYKKENSEENDEMRENYMSIVEFSGTSENDLTVVSGSFVLSAPDYPKPAPPPETELPQQEIQQPEMPGQDMPDPEYPYGGYQENNFENYAEGYLLQ